MKRFVLTFAAVMNLILADQFAKAAAVFYLKGRPPLPVVPQWFDLAYVENFGCAWGMFQGHVWPLAVFAVAALGLLVWKRRSVFAPGWIGTLAEILIYAGILGNLVDRVFVGHVVDFLDFHWNVHHFPCFNLADSYITVAAFLLVLTGFKKSEC